MNLAFNNLAALWPKAFLPCFYHSYISVILTAASAAIPAGLTHFYGWGVSPLLPGVNTDPDKNYMQWNYIVPWCRFSPYIIGILLGYILHTTKGGTMSVVNFLCEAGKIQ